MISKLNSQCKQLLVFFILLVFVVPASASEPPQRGLLAAAGTVGYGDLQVPETWSGPITGSVGISGNRECSLGVQNNSDKDFRISVELVEFSSDRKKRSAGSHQFRLRAGESRERTVNTRNGTAGCALVITRWQLLK